MTTTIITEITLQTLRQLFQDAGYRVEELNDPVANLPYLRSATGGMPFEIRPGNQVQVEGNANALIDFSLIAVFQIQGNLPVEIVNRWNATRRFGRLQISAPLLVLHLDVSVAGGVATRFLRTQLELWDHLIQQLIIYLREELQKMTASPPAATSSQGPSESPADPNPTSVSQAATTEAAQ